MFQISYQKLYTTPNYPGPSRDTNTGYSLSVSVWPIERCVTETGYAVTAAMQTELDTVIATLPCIHSIRTDHAVNARHRNTSNRHLNDYIASRSNIFFKYYYF